MADVGLLLVVFPVLVAPSFPPFGSRLLRNGGRPPECSVSLYLVALWPCDCVVFDLYEKPG